MNHANAPTPTRNMLSPTATGSSSSITPVTSARAGSCQWHAAMSARRRSSTCIETTSSSGACAMSIRFRGNAAAASFAASAAARVPVPMPHRATRLAPTHSVPMFRLWRLRQSLANPARTRLAPARNRSHRRKNKGPGGAFYRPAEPTFSPRMRDIAARAAGGAAGCSRCAIDVRWIASTKSAP